MNYVCSQGSIWYRPWKVTADYPGPQNSFGMASLSGPVKA